MVDNINNNKQLKTPDLTTKRRQWSNRNERLAVSRQRAMQLRLAGYTYAEIGAQLGLSQSGAAKQVKYVMRAVQAKYTDDAEQYITLELARLDQAQVAIYDRVLQGDLPAIDRLLSIQTRRSRLLGLDAPQSTRAELLLPEPIQYVLHDA